MSSEAPHTIVPPFANRGHSAQVRITLHLNGQSHRVAQIGGGRLIFDSPVTFPQTTGTVVINFDGHEERFHVDIHGQLEPTRIVKADIKPI